MDALHHAHPDVSLSVREIRTEGDVSSAPLSQIGGLGVFAKAIEDALLGGQADIAVHSLKDLPTQLPPGLIVAAIPLREDVRDAIIARDGLALSDLPAGARVGTGSGRRSVQLAAMRPDLRFEEIRGNVDTRIRKVESGEYDAAVLALAGLRRLGLDDRATQVFSTDEVLPAVGQGALAIEVRGDDPDAIALVAPLDDADTHAAVTAERAYLARLGGGCRLPIGAHATVAEHSAIVVQGMVAGGDRIYRAEASGRVANAEALGIAVAEDVMSQGAARFIEAV